jgi:AhpC/TSA family
MKGKGSALLQLVILLVMIITLTHAQEKKDGKPADDSSEGPQVGQPAPDFELPWADQAGVHVAKNEWVKLSGLKGSNVILAFYVADWTGG